MTDTATTAKLTRDNAILLLVDHQTKLVSASRVPDPEQLARHVVGLVRAATILGLPIVATTNSEHMFGPMFLELKEALGKTPIIERTAIDAFDDQSVVKAIEAMSRTHVIIAGISLGVCAAFPALSAANRGLRTYVAADASGAFDVGEYNLTVLRLTQAGVTVAPYSPLVTEILANNADPKAQDVYAASNTQFGGATILSLNQSAAA